MNNSSLTPVWMLGWEDRWTKFSRPQLMLRSPGCRWTRSQGASIREVWRKATRSD